MKRFLLILLVSFCFLILTRCSAQALQAMPVQFPPGNGGNSLTGEIHAYSLILKSNGNAVILGKINFSNQNASDQDSYQMTIPGVVPENFVAYQLIPKPVCLQYRTGGNPQECADFNPNPYPDVYNSDFKKLTVDTSGSAVNIKLAQGVREASNSGLIFTYNTPGYVQNFLGRNNFQFETPKVANSIQTLNLSVDTDNQTFHLKVNNEQVSDVVNSAAGISLSLPSADNVRQIAPMIGNSGRVFKTVSSLNPGETVKITGSYSSSVFLLNLDKIAWFAGIFLLLLLLVIVFIKLDLGSKFVSRLDKISSKADKKKNLLLVDLAVGLVISWVLVGVTVLVRYIGTNIFTSYNNDFIWTIILMVFGFLVYGGFLVLPAVFMGLKFGWKHLLWVILFEVLWLGVFLIGYALIFVPSGGSPVPGPIPMIQEKSL